MKSEMSLFRCVAFLSVSVFSIILAYKLGKDQHRTDTLPKSQQLRNTMIALKEGQTIVGVSDTTKAMHFYVRHDEGDSANDEQL